MHRSQCPPAPNASHRKWFKRMPGRDNNSCRIQRAWLVPRILKSTSLAFGVATATFMQGIPLFIIALTKVPTLAMSVMVFEGVGSILFETATASTVQRSAPYESRIHGRKSAQHTSIRAHG